MVKNLSPIAITFLVILLSLAGCNGQKEYHNTPGSPTPNPELKAKLHDSMSPAEIVCCLLEVKNDSDLLILSRYITPGNASAVCQQFLKATDDSIKELFNGHRENTLPEYAIVDLDLSLCSVYEFTLCLTSALRDDPDQLSTQVSQYLYFASIMERQPSPDSLLSYIPCNALFDILKKFEQLNRKNGRRNFTNSETNLSKNAKRRPGTQWPLTLMQSIVNNKQFTPQEKQKILRIIVQKATEEASVWIDNPKEIQNTYDRANKIIDDLIFDKFCEVNLLDIYVNNLLGNHSMFEDKTYKQRQAILEGSSEKWAERERHYDKYF